MPRARSINEKKIKALLAIDEQSLHHQVELTPDEMVAYGKRAWPDGYNDLEVGGLAEFAKRVNEAVPRMDFGPGNLNNGGYAHGFLAGRESSPVVYVVIPRFYMRGRDAELKRAIKDILQAASDTMADEKWVIEGGESTEVRIRVWWD